MNGRGNGIHLNARSIQNSSDRLPSYDELFSRGTNMRSLSNQNYFASVSQTSGENNSSLQTKSPGSGRAAYIQRLDAASSRPTTLDSSGTRRMMPSTYNQVPQAEKAVQGITSTAGVEAGVGAVSAARNMALSAGGMAPVAMAAQAAQQIGQGIGSTLKANDEGKMNADYQKNSQVASVANSQNASLIRNAQQDTINKNYNAAMIGSMFGPLGALAGHFVSSLANSQDRPVFGVNSFSGTVDPTDSGVNRSLNTSAPSGNSEMVDSINGN